MKDKVPGDGPVASLAKTLDIGHWTLDLKK